MSPDDYSLAAIRLYQRSHYGRLAARSFFYALCALAIAYFLPDVWTLASAHLPIVLRRQVPITSPPASAGDALLIVAALQGLRGAWALALSRSRWWSRVLHRRAFR